MASFVNLFPQKPPIRSRPTPPSILKFASSVLRPVHWLISGKSSSVVEFSKLIGSSSALRPPPYFPPSGRFVKKYCWRRPVSLTNRRGNGNGEQDLRILLPWRRMAQDGAKTSTSSSQSPPLTALSPSPGWPTNPRDGGQRNDNVCLVIVAAHFNPHGGPAGAVARCIHRVASFTEPPGTTLGNAW